MQDELTKKMRKEFKKHSDFILNDFESKFNIGNYFRPKPFFIPKLAWYLLINWMLKK